jgi:amidohydrolase
MNILDKQAMKQAVCQRVDELQPVIYEIAEYLHAHPELGTEETLSAAFLRNLLQEQGCMVEDVVADVFPTAFHGLYGEGPFQMGFLAEYDALPGIGHGCGHNIIAAMSVGAALAFGRTVPDQATVHIYGCPAEETAGSKVYMTDAGVFDGLQAALIIHPSDETAIGGTSYATHPLRFTFIGKEAHVADPVYHGINALDALVDFYGKLRALQQTFTKPYILGLMIAEGGTAPNIIPGRAVLRATIRALDADYLSEVMLPQIKQLARETAQQWGAEVEMVHYEAFCKNMVNDVRMDDYFAKNFAVLGETFIRKPDDYASGSTDVGNVSQAIRTSQPEICIGKGIAAHTPDFATAAGSEFARRQALVGAKAMAMTAVDVLWENK